MKNIHQQSFLEYSKKYIGTPYGSFDCWNVVRSFYKEVLGVDIAINGPECPLGPDEAQPMIVALKGEFQEVKKCNYKFGDILLLKLFGRPVHLGIYLDERRILHTQKSVGCIIDRYSRWERMIDGCYRYES